MPFVRRCWLKFAVTAGLALTLAPVVAASAGSALAQRRPAAPTGLTSRTPACFEPCANQCNATGGSNANCSRTCYAQCSGIVGNIDNRF